MVCIHYTNIPNTCVGQISHVKPAVQKTSCNHFFLVFSNPVALFGRSKTEPDWTFKHYAQAITITISLHKLETGQITETTALINSGATGCCYSIGRPLPFSSSSIQWTLIGPA